jgi:sulfite oxidase
MTVPVERLIVRVADPLCAETPLADLAQTFITPADRFYLRTHGTMPVLDAATFTLRVRGNVVHERSFSLAELARRFARHRVSAVLQCAGNRRSELGAIKPVEGNAWNAGAIGNAEWAGFRLADVLEDAGLAPDGAAFVAFTSLDHCDLKGSVISYAVSIPIAKALAPEVLLADSMNGAPLTREHGFPLRTIVPGYAAARSVKWLNDIEVRATPSEGYYQRRDYKLFPAGVDARDADWERGTTIDAMPLNAAICEPENGARIASGALNARGYAIGSDGVPVTRVELTTDGGATWTHAECVHESDARWSWTLWQATLDLAPGEHEIAVRAWDAADQTQPPSPRDVWNFKGYANNAWHRIHITTGAA